MTPFICVILSFFVVCISACPVTMKAWSHPVAAFAKSQLQYQYLSPRVSLCVGIYSIFFNTAGIGRGGQLLGLHRILDHPRFYRHQLRRYFSWLCSKTARALHRVRHLCVDAKICFPYLDNYADCGFRCCLLPCFLRQQPRGADNTVSAVYHPVLDLQCHSHDLVDTTAWQKRSG